MIRYDINIHMFPLTAYVLLLTAHYSYLSFPLLVIL